MWRLYVGLLVCGGALAFYGWNEKKLGEGVGSEPAPITMEELEKGVPDNPWRKIGKHTEVDNVVYSEKKGSIQYAYYPIVSETTVIEAVKKIAEKYGSLEKAPQDAFAKVVQIKVIVKTTRFKTKADIEAFVNKRTDFDRKENVGMVTNRIAALKSDEVNLVKQTFPTFDADKTVIFEENRTPSSPEAAMGFMGGGGVLALIGLGMLVAKRGS